MNKILQGLTVVFLLASALPCFADSVDPLANIAVANKFYEEKRYQEAIDAYESLIHQGLQNGHLYYNLGNAYIRLNQLGPGILNYVRAQKLIPRNEDLMANLKYALKETEDQLLWQAHSPLSGVFFWTKGVTAREFLVLTMILNLVFWSVALTYLIQRTPFWAQMRKLSLGLLIFSLVSLSASYYSENSQRYCVVLAKTVDVKSGMGRDTVTLFKLHEGTILTLHEKNKEWLKISLSADKEGWVPQNAIGI